MTPFQGSSWGQTNDSFQGVKSTPMFLQRIVDGFPELRCNIRPPTVRGKSGEKTFWNLGHFESGQWNSKISVVGNEKSGNLIFKVHTIIYFWLWQCFYLQRDTNARNFWVKEMKGVTVTWGGRGAYYPCWCI
jgi:hypothetical protein